MILELFADPDDRTDIILFEYIHLLLEIMEPGARRIFITADL